MTLILILAATVGGLLLGNLAVKAAPRPVPVVANRGKSNTQPRRR